MFTCEIILAAVLFSAPTDVPVRPAQASWVEALRPCILAAAIGAEIIDPRERVFLIQQDPVGDMAMLRGRIAEFANAPGLSECQRFPERKLINDLLALNRAYRNALNERLAIDSIHVEELRTAISETDQCYQAWDTARDACCDYYYVTVRRQALQLLRELIGAEAFYSGQLPHPIPLRHVPRK